MTDIVLSTLNAKYPHPAFGLRYLLANLGPLQSRARLLEFDLKTAASRVVDAILAEQPRIVGLGIHIWNEALMADVAARLKKSRPDLVLILGGPEMAAEGAEIARLADYIITREGEEAFQILCRDLLEGRRPAGRVFHPAPVDVERLTLPYDYYSDDDLAHRITYVEFSRGCPYHCDYCLSAGDAPVRCFPLPPLLEALDRLLARGAHTLKFVDRTFNLDFDRCCALLTFFLERMRPGLFVHFEMVPDRFPGKLRALLARFPPGSLQLEIGIQTFNPEVAARIHRPLDPEAVENNLRGLRQYTDAILHTDLIAGLPGETLDSFAAGFDRLVRLDPHKIQVGILKRLHGSALARHDDAWKMRYSPRPPYEVLSTSVLGEDTLQGLQRFSRYWERVVNRGRFPETAPLLWRGKTSPFAAFRAFSEWLHLRFGRAHALSLSDLAAALAEYPVLRAAVPAAALRESLRRDYVGPGRPNLPGALNDQT